MRKIFRYALTGFVAASFSQIAFAQSVTVNPSTGDTNVSPNTQIGSGNTSEQQSTQQSGSDNAASTTQQSGAGSSSTQSHNCACLLRRQCVDVSHCATYLLRRWTCYACVGSAAAEEPCQRRPETRLNQKKVTDRGNRILR